MSEAAHRTALLGLIKQLPGDSLIGAEIGVHKGGTSKVLLAGEPRIGRLYMVDQWKAITEGTYADSGDPCARMSQEEQDSAIDKAFENVEQFGRRYSFWRMTSADAAKELTSKQFHFVFIDADHTESGCYADLCAWWPTVRPGGLFSGHDYHEPNGSHHDGVKLAVDRFAREHGLGIQVADGNVWWVRKPE